MTELKTLKEIPFDETHFVVEQTPDKDIMAIEELRKNCVSKIDLKQEAIKDIKEIKNCPKLLASHFEKGKEIELEVWKEGKIIRVKGKEAIRIMKLNSFLDVGNYIKWKNNLTEEDLMTNEEINAREHGERGNN